MAIADSSRESSSDGDLTLTLLICPRCLLIARPGELTCSDCFIPLIPSGKTKQMTTNPPLPKQLPIDDVLDPMQKQLIFEIGGSALPLPPVRSLVIGRRSTGDNNYPDIDLSSFHAAELGVSRFHLTLTRQGLLVFAADLGSTNGTFLNGRRMTPHADRVLRQWDELHLGRLKVTVRLR
jgi:hypothetical protein